MKNLKSRMTEKGFTLIELLVVISIIGMLSSVVLVSLQSARDKGRTGAGISFESSVYHAFGAEAVLRYNFNSSTLFEDSSGNSNTILTSCGFTQDSSTPNSVGGFSGKFSSSADCRLVLNKTVSSLAQKGTISFWVNPDSFTSGIGNIAYIMSTPGWLSVCPASGGAYIALRDVTCTDGVYTTETIPFGKWSHVLISWDSTATSKIVIYINGKLSPLSGVATISPNWASGSTFYIKSFSSGFTGYIDNFAIYTQSMQNP